MPPQGVELTNQSSVTMASRTAAIVISVIVTLALGCQAKSGSKTNGNVSVEWDTFTQQFLDSYFATNPTFAVYQGKHEFDGKLPDWTPESIRRQIESLKTQRAQAMKFNASSHETALPAALQQIRSNLRTPLPRTFVEIGKLTFGGLASYFETDVPAVFNAVADPQVQADFQRANKTAIAATRDAEKWMISLLPEANDKFALGPDLFSKMLQQTERVDIPLEELERAGKQDLDRNLAALKEACEKFAPSTSEAACVAKAEADKPEAGTVEEARHQLSALKAFIQNKQFVSIPGQEEARVAESPPYQRWNFAYIDIVGPYEHGLPSIYYVAPPDPNWTKAEQQAYIPGRTNLLFTSTHEVWPGHFLQFLHSNRSPSRFGQIFVGYAFAEGWGHYAEELAWEAGLGNGDAEVHIGQLTNALLRNVRFLSAIGLHTKGMTIQESDKMFREQAYQDAGNARQQAARGTFDPAYLNYTLGKLMIQKLREDWTATRGGRQAWREFHDKFLSFGGPPIPLVRRMMLGTAQGLL